MHWKSIEMPMKLFILAIAAIGISILLLGVKVLFVKGGRFPSAHVHDIPALREKNITCEHHSQKQN